MRLRANKCRFPERIENSMLAAVDRGVTYKAIMCKHKITWAILEEIIGRARERRSLGRIAALKPDRGHQRPDCEYCRQACLNPQNCERRRRTERQRVRMEARDAFT